MSKFTFIFILFYFVPGEVFSLDHKQEKLFVGAWDTVPHQYIVEPTNISIIAYHEEGIKEVQFTVGGKVFLQKKTPSNLDHDDLLEFSFKLIPSDFQEGSINVNVTISPLVGSPKLLKPLKLYIGNLREKEAGRVYVSNKGQDNSMAGGARTPYKTIKYALSNLKHNGEIILKEPGVYYLENSKKKLYRKTWVTISGAEDGSPDEFILTTKERRLVRLNTNLVKFKNLSIDFAKVQQIYPENKQTVWFDNVVWFDSNGESFVYKKNVPPVRTSRYINGYYVTNSTAMNMTYGFVDALYAKNIKLFNISGDALQNARIVLKAKINNMNGKIKKNIHSDIFQYYGEFNNVIVNDVMATNINHVQNFFFDHVDSKFSNMAFFNVCIHNTQGNPPFSQMASLNNNILFNNITTENQDWILRDDFIGPKKFIANNVKFKNSEISRLARGLHMLAGMPQGVLIENTIIGKLKHSMSIMKKKSRCY